MPTEYTTSFVTKLLEARSAYEKLARLPDDLADELNKAKESMVLIDRTARQYEELVSIWPARSVRWSDEALLVAGAQMDEIIALAKDLPTQ